MLLSELLDRVAPALQPLLGTLVGAILAFRFNDLLNRRKEHARQLCAAQHLLLTLASQRNTLTCFAQTHLNPVREHPGRFIILRAVRFADSTSQTVHSEDLSFLFQLDAGQELFNAIVAADQYHATVQAANDRARFHADVAQPALAKGGLAGVTRADSNQVHAALGAEVAARLARETDDLYQHVDLTIKSLDLVSSQLVAKLRRRFGRRAYLPKAIPGDSAPPSTAQTA